MGKFLDTSLPTKQQSKTKVSADSLHLNHYFPVVYCWTGHNVIIVADYSKQVKQRVSENFMYIHNLEERIPYTFSVRAQTIDYGPAAEGNVTTGPQPGSPGRPRDLLLRPTLSAVRLSWVNGNSGKGPILGYYIESRPKGN